ncbi:lysophospholipid acyltransferase family protein [Polynucleobacter sp. CS-Odin-A6]|uniref:lysophospholipid acyltransferase family protein n=1 Tax=Polynucleobacter sp. CS-Odin-A6 TaxID=2689106 RepID=UPI001C0D7542|nr:lysophospholipid acyltransferase family protein [Polynucleobacter sp. CS-Odin-A6]
MRKLFLKLSLKTIASLPLGVVQVLGGFLGGLAYVGSKQYRQLFKSQYGAVIHHYRLQSRLWTAITASGMLFSDSLWIWRNSKKALATTIVHNWKVVQDAMSEGKGMIILCPHLGGFEIIPRFLAGHFPATIMYRPSRQAWLNELVEAGRAYPNMHFVPTNLNGVRQMTRALSKGEAIAILPDQVPSGGDGIWADFFGRPAYTTTLPIRLANRHDTPAVMFTAKRRALGKGWIIDAKRLNSFSSDANSAAKELNTAIEDAILLAPEQFIWSYNRYKHPAGAELPPGN